MYGIYFHFVGKHVFLGSTIYYLLDDLRIGVTSI